MLVLIRTFQPTMGVAIFRSVTHSCGPSEISATQLVTGKIWDIPRYIPSQRSLGMVVVWDRRGGILVG